MAAKSVVILDPGHGGNAPAGGSSSNRATGASGLKEKDIALDVARLVRDLLSGSADVRLTRDADKNLSLTERAKIAKDAYAAVFVSLHFNGSENRNLDDTSTWTAKDAGERSVRLAKALASNVSSALGTRNLGVRKKNLGVLLPARHAGSTAVCLAELAYLTNTKRETSLEKHETRQALARAIASSVRTVLSGRFDNSAPHILEGRETNYKDEGLYAIGSSPRRKAIEILRAMDGLGVCDSPPGRQDAYIDAIFWGEPDKSRRNAFRNCNKSGGSCILSSCGLVVRSVLRLLGASDPLLDAPYRDGTAIQAPIDFAAKHGAVINVTKAADIVSAQIEPGDIIHIAKGTSQHIFMVTDITRNKGSVTYHSVDGGTPSFAGDPKANCKLLKDTTGLPDGNCCGIKASIHTLADGATFFSNDGNARPIQHIIKLDKLKFTEPVIELTRKQPAQTQGLEATALDAVNGGRAVVDCPVLNSHGPTQRNLVMRWNVEPGKIQMVDVAVHLHGFVGNQIDLSQKESTSGVGFQSDGVKRTRPTLALIPHGQRTNQRSSDGNSWVVEFPALTDSKDGLDRLVKWSLDEFAKKQLGQAAGSVVLGRLILWAHSGGGARLLRILAHCNPDEVHFLDALYGGSDAAQRWAARRITLDAGELGALKAAEWTNFMATWGGSLRSVFLRNSGTQSGNRSLHDSLECSLATVNDPAIRDFLRKFYRASGTHLSHNEIPAIFSSQLLVNAGAELKPPTTSLSAPASCPKPAKTQGWDYEQSAECNPVPSSRSSSAFTGSAFLASIMGEKEPPDWTAREAKIAEQLKTGNLPPALWNWKDISVSYTDSSGRKHTGAFQVMPDYLAIGSDADYALIPMDAITAQEVADALCCMLPTAKMVLDIYRQAATKLVALPRDYWKTAPHKQKSTWAYQEHDQAIKKQRTTTFGTLTAGHKKDVVISPALQQEAFKGRLAFFGFFKADGTPWQGSANGRASLAHEPTYADYSHGVRLVHPVMTVDGERKTVERVLADPMLAGLLSNEGPVPVPRITAKRQSVVKAHELGRSWIIEPEKADDWSRMRIFGPLTNKTGKTVLKVTTRPIPTGGLVRWSVPPANAGHYKLAGGANVQNGLTAEVTGIRPGKTKIDIDVFDAAKKSIESQKYDLCIPQFVEVTENIHFEAFLKRVRLLADKDNILVEAKRTCDHLLTEANVRTIWAMAPFKEKVPAHVPFNFVTKADIGGDPNGPFAKSIGLLGITRDMAGSFTAGAKVGPGFFDEVIDLFPGAMTDPNATDIDDGVVAVINAALGGPPLSSTAASVLASTVVARITGCSLAHEIIHSLIGFAFPFGAAHTTAVRDIMLNGPAFTFEHLTGIQISNAAKFPAPGSFADMGIEHINRPQVDGSLPPLMANFPFRL